MFGPRGGVALADEPFDHLVEVAGGDARQALNVLEGAVALADDEDVRDADGRVSPTLAHVESRRAAARPRLRPRRRRPLRHRVRVHQEPARQRPGRRAVLAGGDGRGRRGPPVHRPPADHQRLRGRGQRRPAGASRSRSPRPRRSTTSACRRPSTRSPRPRPTSRRRPSRTAPAGGYWAAAGDVVDRGSLPVPTTCATPRTGG